MTSSEGQERDAHLAERMDWTRPRSSWLVEAAPDLPQDSSTICRAPRIP